MRKRTVTTEEYMGLREESAGLCVACGAITYGGVEPDARDYPCESCDERKLMGIEEALFEGAIEISGE
jgi:hypothetical protein